MIQVNDGALTTMKVNGQKNIYNFGMYMVETQVK